MTFRQWWQRLDCWHTSDPHHQIRNSTRWHGYLMLKFWCSLRGSSTGSLFQQGKGETTRWCNTCLEDTLEIRIQFLRFGCRYVWRLNTFEFRVVKVTIAFIFPHFCSVQVLQLSMGSPIWCHRHRWLYEIRLKSFPLRGTCKKSTLGIFSIPVPLNITSSTVGRGSCLQRLSRMIPGVPFINHHGHFCVPIRP